MTLVHYNSRAAVCRNLLAAVLVRIQARLSDRHLAEGYPQVAVFSFDHIGARINAFGRYEHDVLCALVVFLRSHGFLRGACLDIGANIGNHTLFFARHFGVVHAFEPGRRPCALLQENTRLTRNVIVHCIGLSDQEGTLTLVAPLHNVGAGSLRGKSHFTGPVDEEGVEVLPLDAVPGIELLDISLVKIDVEGLEADVLRGAEGTLLRCRPAVVFEQQAEEIDGGDSPAIAALRKLGYSRFFECVRSPSTPSRPLTIALKLLRGEKVYFKSVDRFREEYYPMIVALP